MVSEVEFIKSWNKVIEFLISANTAWEKHRDLMMERGSADNLTTYEAQKMAALLFNRSTSFFNAMEGFWPYCEINGGLGEFLLPLPVEERIKEEAPVEPETPEEHKCGVCGYLAKSVRGLKRHKTQQHSKKPKMPKGLKPNAKEK